MSRLPKIKLAFQRWYNHPFSVHVEFKIKKSTFFIGLQWALILYLVWLHFGHVKALPLPVPQPKHQYLSMLSTIPQLDKAQIEEAQTKDVPVPQTVNPVGTSIVPNCGDNQYANFIYMHESGCNTGAVNALGCRGIGQACPGSKLPCGADYGCQNDYFTNYANSVYGGWIGAYSFWVAHGWW